MTPNTSSQGTAGIYANGSTDSKQSYNLVELIRQMKKNFIERDIEIMDGLMFNQYKTLRTIHYYLNSKFEGGDLDENGNEKFFHNIINHRNAHTTKNIDLDTKDVRVETDVEGKYWATWLMRMELRAWMKEADFSVNLNQVAEDLPKFGSVVWKKTVDTDENGESIVCVKSVDLRDLIVDQTADRLRDSQVVCERIVMSSQQVQDKIKDGWDETAVKALVATGNMPVRKKKYLENRDVESSGAYSLTDTLPSIDVYEVWGWIPETYLPEKIRPSDPDPTKYKYVMAVVGGIEAGAQSQTLYAEIASEEDFPYKELHMRKTPGRWLGIGNTELLIPLQVRMNELINRFFTALRLGSVHLFQTRGKLLQKNLLQDSQDGDIIESTHPIDPLTTEIRAFAQYQNEMNSIEMLADKICNTPEVVTGAAMPSATPFRLGAQQGVAAAKIFDFIRENFGIFVGEVVCDWILPSIGESITEEHVLNLMGSAEDLAVFDEAYRKSVLFEQVKDYVLKSHYLPSQEEFATAEKALADQMKGSDKKIKIEKGFFDAEFIEKCRIICDPTGETVDKTAQGETLGNILQIVTSNPMIMQDPNGRMIIGKIMESAGISPISLSGFISQPDSSLLPPGAPEAAAAASPSQKKFAQNPGSAGAPKGMSPESVAANIQAQAK